MWKVKQKATFSDALPKASMFLQDMRQYCVRLLSRSSVRLSVCLATVSHELTPCRLQRCKQVRTCLRIRLKTKIPKTKVIITEFYNDNTDIIKSIYHNNFTFTNESHLNSYGFLCITYIPKY